MANATRVDASSVAQKLKGAVENEPVVRPAVQKSAAPGYVKSLSDSSGFRLSRLLGHLQNIPGVNADAELDACRKFYKSLAETDYAPNVTAANSVLIPMSFALLSDDARDSEGARVMKSMWAAGVGGYDPDEEAWLARRVYKSQSAFIDNQGGSLVAPPVQGELIELMRPKQILQSLGATTVPLPPNGKIVFPRQTTPTTMYFVGENTSVTESGFGTGQIALQSRKAGVYTVAPNELLKYGSAAADGMIRKDIAKTFANGIDYYALYGDGGSAQPKGLVNFTGTNQLLDYAGVTPAPKGIGNNGNTLRPEDGYRMIGLIEERNFEFTGWVTRPLLANGINGYRADSVTPGDAAGQFVTAVTRAISDKMPGTNFCGYKVGKSNIVKNTYTKGSNTACTELFGGQWEHLMIGMYGAVEITTSNVAGSTFQQDQTAIRGLVHFDSNLRYEGAFVRYKELVNG